MPTITPGCFAKQVKADIKASGKYQNGLTCIGPDYANQIINRNKIPSVATIRDLATELGKDPDTYLKLADEQRRTDEQTARQLNDSRLASQHSTQGNRASLTDNSEARTSHHASRTSLNDGLVHRGSGVELDGLLDFFTDVHGLIDDLVAFLTNDQPRVRMIYGNSGLGKSSYLRVFKGRIANAGHLTSLVGVATSAESLLALWSAELQSLGAVFKGFQSARRKWLARSTVPRSHAELALHLPNPALAGQALAPEAVPELTDAFLTDLQGREGTQRIVLMLDTLERSFQLEEWLKDFAARLPEKARLLLAGQKRVHWLSAKYCRHLKAVDAKARAALARRYCDSQFGRHPSARLLEAILQRSNGYPLWITTGLYAWATTSEEDFEVVESVARSEFVKAIQRPLSQREARMFEGMCILRRFNKSAIRHLLNQDELDSVTYDKLIEFPFVESFGEDRGVRSEIRDSVSAEVCKQERERYHLLHDRAASYFRDELLSAGFEDEEKLTDEMLFHSAQADERAGLQLFLHKVQQIIMNRQFARLQRMVSHLEGYGLKSIESRQWQDYFAACVMFYSGQFAEAEAQILALRKQRVHSDLLRGHIAKQLAELWIRGEVRGARDMRELSDILNDAEQCLSSDLPALFRIYACREVTYFWDDNAPDAIASYDELLKRIQGNLQASAYALGLKKSCCALIGDLKGAEAANKSIEAIVGKGDNHSLMRTTFVGFTPFFYLLTGRYHESERLSRLGIEFYADTGDEEAIAAVKRDLCLMLGMQDHWTEAKTLFSESSEVYSRYKQSVISRAMLLSFWGVVLTRKGDFVPAARQLEASYAIKRRIKDWLGVPELKVWLGELHETVAQFSAARKCRNELVLAERAYKEAAKYHINSRRYFHWRALTGLARVFYKQGKTDEFAKLVATNEPVLIENEYNDLLASTRLFQGHATLVHKTATEGSATDVALHYYQDALLHALRFNRFLLDEILGGRAAGSPQLPLIPWLIKHSPRGHSLMQHLARWWQLGKNELNRTCTNIISRLSEELRLVDAEHIVRRRELGNGEHQRTVLEQIESA